MHTSLRGTGVLSGVQSRVLFGLGFSGLTSAEAVHQPSFVYQLTHADVMSSRSKSVLRRAEEGWAGFPEDLIKQLEQASSA
jgi:hypothetical protein